MSDTSPPVMCAIDGRPVGPGGTKNPPRCARCYQRQRRGLPDTAAPAYAGDRTEKIATKVNPKLARAVRHAAQRAGLSVSMWLRQLIERTINAAS